MNDDEYEIAYPEEPAETETEDRAAEDDDQGYRFDDWALI